MGDNINNCPGYAAAPQKYCENNWWVKKNCKKSCQLCEEKALELWRKLVFSANEKKDNQFWYFHKSMRWIPMNVKICPLQIGKIPMVNYVITSQGKKETD